MSEKTVIVSDDCPHCQKLKKRIAEKGLAVRIVPFDSEEGAKIAREHQITAVPECVIVGPDGKTKVCSDKEFAELT